MGYSTVWWVNTQKELKDYVINSCKDNEQLSVIDSGSVTGEIYLLLHDKIRKENFIMCYKVVLINGEFGYKEFSESSFPYMFNCPKKLLEKSTCNEGDAYTWRQECFKRINNKKRVKTLKHGDKISLNGNVVTFLRPYTKSFSQIVYSTADGKTYRCQSQYVDFINE